MACRTNSMPFKLAYLRKKMWTQRIQTTTTPPAMDPYWAPSNPQEGPPRFSMATPPHGTQNYPPPMDPPRSRRPDAGPTCLSDLEHSCNDLPSHSTADGHHAAASIHPTYAGIARLSGRTSCQTVCGPVNTYAGSDQAQLRTQAEICALHQARQECWQRVAFEPTLDPITIAVAANTGHATCSSGPTAIDAAFFSGSCDGTDANVTAEPAQRASTATSAHLAARRPRGPQHSTRGLAGSTSDRL